MTFLMDSKNANIVNAFSMYNVGSSKFHDSYKYLFVLSNEYNVKKLSCSGHHLRIPINRYKQTDIL